MCSIIDLIARPGEFDGRKILTFGVIHVDADGAAVYLTREHAKRSIAVNGIWLDHDWPLDPTWVSADGRWVAVEGVFSKDHHGPLGIHAGAIANVSRLDITRVSRDVSEPENAR